MPYRRSTRRGRSYSRRAAAPTLWVRSEASNTDGRVPATSCFAVDILHPLHSNEAIMRVGGSYENAPTATGRTVIRVHGTCLINWNVTATNGPDITDGIVLGVVKGTWNLPDADSTIDLTEFDAQNQPYPLDPRMAANTSDWAFWQWVTPFTAGAHRPGFTLTAGAGTNQQGNYVQMVTFDMKARRALRELGETLLFCARPTGPGTAGVDNIAIYSSVLLR